ncbi:MAG: hypothetical protein V2A78_02105 [bacterium]
MKINRWLLLGMSFAALASTAVLMHCLYQGKCRGSKSRSREVQAIIREAERLIALARKKAAREEHGETS